MKSWTKKSGSEINEMVSAALDSNTRFSSRQVMGLPATGLSDVLSRELAGIRHPWIRANLENPNHIGCHTLNRSEKTFAGTQRLERECIAICAERILCAKPGAADGYLSSGGTESNIQALWILRNDFRHRFGANNEAIEVLYSEDTHYSVPKACDLLGLEGSLVAVNKNTRQMRLPELVETIKRARQRGKRYFIWVANMGTTVFGSVDDIDEITGIFDDMSLEYRVHVDAAFGGFYLPFFESLRYPSFEHRRVDSFSLDAHKLLGAPYGTGIFLVRKGYLQRVRTREAGYVFGEDHTLCGSRSGANAIALWIILMTYGSKGWSDVCVDLERRTSRLCHALDALEIRYFRHSEMNQVAIRSEHITSTLAQRFTIIPDDHVNPSWYKVVVMPHVTDECIDELIVALGENDRERRREHDTRYA
jgi:tyrosine decarboxylase / aspartate 1-decarboxylase